MNQKRHHGDHGDIKIRKARRDSFRILIDIMKTYLQALWK